jgi:uncharacterized protein (DUF2235 family)
MPKNIVVCCDGTANEFAQNLTNVVKLYSTLVNSPDAQVTYYHPGLGTMEPAGALTTFSRKATKLLGMAVGYGLSNDIRDAYVFLMKNYNPEDRLFFFGFSRGSYTVKAVCSLLKMYGLIRRDNEALVPYATRLMMGIDRARRGNQSHHEALDLYFGLARDFKSTLASDCKPWFVGVWDTVSSVGWIENPLKLPYISNNPDIQIGRHAISMDERRAFFRSHLWRRPADPNAEYGPKDVKQVWFPGVHCDVGGGYPEPESGLSKGALDWMLEEAKQAGLLVDETKVQEVLGKGSAKHARPDPNAEMHESLKGWWNLAELIPKKHFDATTGETRRKPNLWARRRIPAGSPVHESAFERKDYESKIPEDAVRVKTR